MPADSPPMTSMPRPLDLLRRPRWRTLFILAAPLALLLWPVEQLAERYYRERVAEQSSQTLELYVANLLGTLRRYEALPQIMGDLPALPPTSCSTRCACRAVPT